MKKPAWMKLRISTGVDPIPDQQALVALAMGYVLAVGPHLVRLPWWLTFIVVILFLWRMWIMRRAAAIPGRLLRFLLLAGAVLLIYRQHGTLLGRDAGVALLVLLTALKFLEIREFRDCMIVVFLCLLIGLTSFLYSQDLLLGAYLFAVVIVLTAVMQYLNHSDRGRLPAMLAQSARLVLFALPVGIVLFIMFPRVPLGLFGLPNDAHSGLTGMSDVIAPGSINQLNESDDIAFRVEFDGEPPAMKQRYWRGLVLGAYQDNRWRRYQKYPRILEPGLADHDPEQVLYYDILLEPSSKRWVFALDLPVEKPAGLYWDVGQTLRAPQRLLERARFRLGSALDARMTSLAAAERDRYTAVPRAVRDSLGDFAGDMYRRAGSDAAYVEQVLGFFREKGFVYTLQPPALGDEPMRSFLFETRRGYCEHYASAFALLMRLAGVPARLIAGYQGGEWNPQGEYMIVRQSDAHAWTEVWLEGRGWMRVDPTAVVAPERIEFGLTAIRLLAEQGQQPGSIDSERLLAVLARPVWLKAWDRAVWFWDDLNTGWYLWVIGYDQDRQQGLLKRLGLESLGWSGMLVTGIVLVGIILLIQGVFLVRSRWRRGAPVVEYYDRCCQRLAAIGLQRRPSEGPLDFARRVQRREPRLGAELVPIIEIYVSIHYAGREDKDLLQQMKKRVKAFRPAKLLVTGEGSR